MQKYFALAAVAASALFTTSAGATDLHVFNPTSTMVRISVVGKSADQLKTEIVSAANTVCGAADNVCVQDAVSDANRQLAVIQRVKNGAGRVDVSKDGPMTMRVSLVGKSHGQILQDIQAAAHAVCQPMVRTPVDYRSCVGQAVSDARFQLRHLEQASAGVQELAQN